MGYYINETKLGPLGLHGKADALIRDEGAVLISEPPLQVPQDKAVICVVNNGSFEAAAFAYDDRELIDFNREDDYRPKIWILMPLDRAKELSGYNR